MSEDSTPSELGMKALFTKTLLLLYTSMLAFTGQRAEAGTPTNGSTLPSAEDFVARLRTLKRKPQLVLKLNAANPMASKAMMHTSHSSHRSHSSHSSHYSSSGSGHSSHSSHSSHYSSSSYTTPSSSYSTPAPRSYTPSSSSSSSSSTGHTKKATTTSRSTTTLPAYTGYTNAKALPMYALGDRVLKLGDRGTDVQALQQLLIGKGYDLTADGSFGLATNTAVKDFQAREGLTADGIAGFQTIVKLQLF